MPSLNCAHRRDQTVTRHAHHLSRAEHVVVRPVLEHHDDDVMNAGRQR
jgi:hypothetical protein